MAIKVNTYTTHIAPPTINGKYNDTTTTAVIEVLEGLPVILMCPLIGHPNLNFYWQQNSIDNDVIESNKLLPKFSENVRVQNGGKILNILKSSIKDNGLYSCVGKNDAGERKFSFNVSVLGKKN